MNFHDSINTTMGLVTITVDEQGNVLRCSFDDRPSHDDSMQDPARCAVAVQQVREYFAGSRKEFDLPLRVEGTVFQKEVWSALRQVPYGTTCSYADLARTIGRPAAVRAVGAANGANRIAIIIPCHRVIGANGKLVGYASGLPRKEALLAIEQKESKPDLPAPVSQLAMFENREAR